MGSRGRLTAPRPLLVVGSGGFGRETVEAVRASEPALGQPRWNLLGFLDDDRSRWGTEISGTLVLGAAEAVADYPDAAVVVCTGHPGDFGSKRRIVERLRLPPERYAMVVHPAAVIPRSCRLGEGTVVLAGVVATADVQVGAHGALMPQTVLTHDDMLGDYVTVGAGARIAGSVHVGDGSYLGSGCLIREGRMIGAGALVGMGSVVIHDVPAGEVWAGVPARYLRPVA